MMVGRCRTRLAVLSLSVTALGSGCAGEASSLERTLLRRTSLVRPGSSRDFENRYRSTLRLFVAEKAAQEQGSSGECSGVLIAPQVVLTAGHCVCIVRKLSVSEREALGKEAIARMERRGNVISRAESLRGQRIDAVMDSSRCASSAKVRTIIYEPPVPGEAESSRQKTYSGSVRPHPRLELLYDDEGSVVWSSADLAVIRLDMPVKDFPVVKRTTAEARVGEPIVMVGYGPGEPLGLAGERHSGENQVSWLRRLDSGSVELVVAQQRMPTGQVASHLDAGDSGGGCWRTGSDGNAVLIGIAGGNAKNGRGESLSVFTSLYSHEEWLSQQLAEP
ncbi:trypsin-like serine protease [Archangium lansingense]|uniref:Trypsin-like serine protease n=1 Tax=Archangium lansingense TaxID=2995310 RepID=A0ABT4AKT9_9BACT|nr:trypsin-like peptidase domain-containing protein [Archangium lansinium]MCY1081474.1 trypsin-like serine protease [Archangium lansinium]